MSQPLFENRSVFVSSTFRDMQGERDMLRDIVLTELSDYGESIAVNINFVDLRWGISTIEIDDKEEKERLVLRVCLDRIDETRPFMIVLLGDRYGWIPEGNLLQSAAGEKQFAVKNARSVTALEIEYGLLNQYDQMEHCFFYFREPLPYHEMGEHYQKIYSDAHDNKPNSVQYLRELKDQIQAKYPNSIRSYKAQWNSEKNRISDFGDLPSLVLNDLKFSLEYEAALRPPPMVSQRQLYEVEKFFEKKRQGFCGRGNELATLEDFALNKDGIIVLVGDSGLGKSAIMAKLYSILKADSSQPLLLLPFSCGISMELASPTSLLEMWVEILSACHGESGGKEIYDKEVRFSFSQLVDLLEQLLFICSTSRRIIMLIDAVDQFGLDPRSYRLGYLPVSLPKNISVVMSATPDIIMDELLVRRAKILTLGGLEKKDIGEIAATAFRINAKPRISAAVETAIVEKANVETPIILSAIVQALLSLDEDDFNEANTTYFGNPDDVIIELLLLQTISEIPETPRSVYPALIKKATKRIDESLLKTSLGLIANSVFGLRIGDIENIFKSLNLPFSQTEFYFIVKKFKQQFIQSETGAWVLNHQFVKSSIKNYLGTDDYNHMLADYFAAAESSDTFSLECAFHHLVTDMRIEDFNNLIRKACEQIPESLEIFISASTKCFSAPEQKELLFEFIHKVYASQDFISDQRMLPFITMFFSRNNELMSDEELSSLLSEMDNAFRIDLFIQIVNIHAAEYLSVRAALSTRLGNLNMGKNMARFALSMGEKVFGELYFDIVHDQPIDMQFSHIYPDVMIHPEDLQSILTLDFGVQKAAKLSKLSSADKREMNALLLRIDAILMIYAQNLLAFEVAADNVERAAKVLEKYDFSFLATQSSNASDDDFYFAVMRYRLGYCCAACGAFLQSGNVAQAEIIYYLVSGWTIFLNYQKTLDDPRIMQQLGDLHMIGAAANCELSVEKEAVKAYTQGVYFYRILYRLSSGQRQLRQYIDAALTYAEYLVSINKDTAAQELKQELWEYLSILERRYQVDTLHDELFIRARNS